MTIITRNIVRLLLVAVTTTLSIEVAAQQPPGGHVSNEVLLCQDPGYKGTCYAFFLEPNRRFREVHELPPNIDNETSSIWVGDGVEAYVFRYRDYMGPNREMTSATALYGPPGLTVCGSNAPQQGWDNEISSLIIAPANHRCNLTPGFSPRGVVDGVHLVSNTKTGPDCPEAYYPLPENPAVNEVRIPRVHPDMDNRATTAYLCGDLEVELYSEPHFKGKQVIIRGGETVHDSEFQLANHGIANTVSSLVVRVPPTSPGRSGRGDPTKHRAPPAGPQQAIIPGPITVPGGVLTFEHGMNRIGNDYKSFDLPEARPELCRDACQQDPKCLAYTYVKPGIQGPRARCWLKSATSPPKPDGCCVSGERRQ